MKQFLTLFTAAVIGLTAVSCNMKDVYTITNMDDIVTVNGEYLVSDFGATYRVTEDKTDSQDWKQDGNRLYVVLDVLNRQLEISLKKANIMEIREAEPFTVLDEKPKDPVVVALQSVSGGYVNLALQIYMAKGTECPHNILFQYRQKPDSNSEVELYVLHEGNNENPTVIPEDDLKTEIRFYSIPLASIAPSQSTQLTLTLDTLVKDSDGKYSIQRITRDLVRSGYQY
jgi:hypothetical protein